MRFQPFDRLRMLAAVVVGLAFMTTFPTAAEERSDHKSLRTVIKATMHIDVSEVQSVLELLEVHFAVKPDQNLIVLRGENGAIENALKVIDALDTPRPSIDLQVFVLAASKDKNVNVPKELEATVSHLQGVFGYSGFELLDNILLSVLEGRRGRVDGGILLGDETERTGYHFSFQQVSVVPEEGQHPNIRLRGLRFEVDGKIAGTPRASLTTDVQIREGQKAVIGSSTPRGVGETLILVVQAKASPDRSWKSSES